MVRELPQINFEKELNSEQLAAVSSPPDRAALVLAGAGSGKTRTLTYRVAWLISECGLSPREILLLTFTNKAARQMLDRISELTGIAPYEFWGGTFHSVGSRFLRIEGEAVGIDRNFTILDADDSEKLLKRAVESAFPKFFANKSNPRASLIGDIISYRRNTCSSMSDAMAERFDWVETPSSQLEEIERAYERERRAGGCVDFDDILELWKRLLEENQEIRKKYSGKFKNILVDEYQDTNTLQGDILSLLADRGQISAVGDDAQCIYSWRGANIENILNFRSKYPSATIYKIERNYRSTPQILDFANGILSDMPIRSDEYRKRLVGVREGKGKPLLIKAFDGNSQGRQVADCIREIASGSRYSYSDIAVLYRSHYQAMDLQLRLQYLNIPFTITSGLKFFEQSHVKDIVSQIKFAANPRDLAAFLRFVGFIPKVGGKTADKIYSEFISKAGKFGDDLEAAADCLSSKEVLAKVPKAGKERFLEMAECVAGLAKMMSLARKKALEKMEGSGLARDKNAWLRQSDLFVSPKGDLEGKWLPKDMVKFACEGWYREVMKTLYENWEERCSDFDALYEYASRYSDVEDFLANITLEVSENAVLPSGGEARADRVRLMTVHQAKGLEFPVVFIIGAADGLFPIKRSIEEGGLDEERRLFYVAATRAKDHLIIVYPSAGMMNGNFETCSPSRFLEAVDPSLYVTNL